MKVLHVIPSIPEVRGGPSQATLELVKTLRQHQIDAEIVTTNDNGPDLLDVPLQQRIDYKGVPVWFFNRFSPSHPAIRDFAFSGQFTTWLWQNITQYDVVHVHALFSYPATVAMAIARLRRVPYIVIPHGLLCAWSLQQRAQKKQLYLKLVERSNLEHCQALHFTTAQEQQEVAALGLHPPSYVISHGLSVAPTLPNARQRLRQMLNRPDDEPIILFLSRLHYKKGLDYLIPALGTLKQHRFTFVLAGSGTPEYEAEVGALLDTAGIRQRSHLAGFVTGELKDLLIQGADLFALTSHSENFGVVVLEGLAAGLPMLLTPGVALAPVIQQHQLGYVTELEIPAIAQAIDHHLTHPMEAEAISDRARKLISEHYTWDKIAQKMIQTYTDIISINKP